jgi:hypothetical protein
VCVQTPHKWARNSSDKLSTRCRTPRHVARKGDHSGILVRVADIRAGQRYGQWVTTGQSRIGGGGNGEVWAVSGDDGRSGAIKILRVRRGAEGLYRLGRFRDEIGFLLAHPEFPGVLPLLDSHLSGDVAERSWYVMPVAIPIQLALGEDPEPRAVITAVAEVAGTLEALADEGVAHRDIKPDNLFKFNDQWVIGDFGLVTYPDKDPRTEHGRKLGPTDYMAPEMRQDADNSAPGPADVWALAKTLWVLLTGETLPLPGTHRASEPAHTLRERITFTFAAELDRLLEQATQIAAHDRVPISAMARELRACLADPPEARSAAGVAELRARAAALTAISRQAVTDGRNRRALAADSWNELAKIVYDAGTELGEALSFEVRAGESGYEASAMFGHPAFSPFDGYGSACLLLPPGEARPNVEVIVAAAMRLLRDDGIAEIAALLRVDRIHVGKGVHDPHGVWAKTYRDIPLASAQAANALAEIRAGFANGFEEAMKLSISIFADGGTAHGLRHGDS